jgi:Asp-tRNA(Asn)/Glu-tRNA(Gln) amidotransferase C subunit
MPKNHLLRRQSFRSKVETDDLGVPLTPTWSIHDLLSTYSKPTLSAKTLIHLHELSALTPPAENTQKFTDRSNELTELIRLVDAVRLVDTDSVRNDGVPDGRVWEKGRGLPLQSKAPATDDETLSSGGKTLLQHAEKLADGYYVVDSTPPRRQ